MSDPEVEGFEKKLKTDAADNWNGNVTWTQTSKSAGKRKWDDHSKEGVYRWDFFFLQLEQELMQGEDTLEMHQLANVLNS